MNSTVLALVTIATLVTMPPGQVVTTQNRQEALRHYRAGEQALHTETFDQAEREFQTATRLDPTLDLAFHGLGRVYMATKRYTLAVRAFTDCRDVFTRNASTALLDQSANQQRLDDQIRALEDAKQGFESGVGKTANTFATIQTLAMQINTLKFQRKRGADQPAGIPAWISLSLGSAYFRTDAMAEAEREYREALKAEPKLGEAHNNLAVVLMLTKRYAEADQEVKAAESAGFKVSQQFKDDLKKAMGKT